MAMALRLAEIEPRQYEYVFTPTGNELPVMEEHMQHVESLLGSPIINLSPQTLVQIIDEQKMLPNFWARFCTRKIKIYPFEKFIREAGECTVYVGIMADESGDREGVDYEKIEGITRRFPMDEWGWTIQDVLSYLDCRGVEIPYRTDCAWCFFQTLYEWYLLWRDYPEIFRQGEEIEEKYQHTFRTPGRDTWPVRMAGLRQRFEEGHIPKDRRTKRKVMCSICAR